MGSQLWFDICDPLTGEVAGSTLHVRGEEVERSETSTQILGPEAQAAWAWECRQSDAVVAFREAACELYDVVLAAPDGRSVEAVEGLAKAFACVAKEARKALRRQRGKR